MSLTTETLTVEKETTVKTHYIVYIATAQMPGSCPYPYDYCAVLEVPENVERPTRIDAKDVVSVVARWAPFPRKGSTPRSGRIQALTEARELAADLNLAKAFVLPIEPPRDLSRVAARTCPVSGMVSHG